MKAIPILLYHSIGDDPSPALTRYTLSPARLRDHMAVIAAGGWRVVTVGQLVSETDRDSLSNEPMLALTFDDGFADTADNAAPILAEHGYGATLYVTTGCVGSHADWLGPAGRRPMASWQQLRDLSKLGWELGAHAVDHVALDVLAPAEARRQVRHSRAIMQEELGVAVESFAYPHGYHSASVRQEVIAAGFHTACAVKNELSHAHDDRYALARVTVRDDMTAEALGQLLASCTEDAPSRSGGRERIRTTAWRGYRRMRHRAAGRATR